MPAIRRPPLRADSMKSKTATTVPGKPSSAQKSHGLHPQLLEPNGRLTLRLGVDYGSGNSTCAFVIVDKNETGYFTIFPRIQALHTRNELIRFPTVLAIKPVGEGFKHAELVFAEDAVASLHLGDLRFNMMFYYQKLGLIDGYDGVFESDKHLIENLFQRHDKALKFARKFDRISVLYPGTRKRVAVSIHSIEDVIIQSLKYFLALVKENIRQKLHLKPDQIDEVFELNTEVGFAAPTFWKDTMLDNFLHLIEEAGWPKRARIWSEPKCALSAYVASEWVKLHEHERPARKKDLLSTIMVMIDIGAGSLDATTAQAVEVNELTIKFATITESSGSLCGGYLLNSKIENKLKGMISRELTTLKETQTWASRSTITTEDFMQSFFYDESRHNFQVEEEDDDDDEFVLERKLLRPIRFRGSEMGAAKQKHILPRGIVMSVEDMAAAHDTYLKRVFIHIDEQLARTRRVVDEDTTKIKIVLVGGVTRAPYIVEKIQEYATTSTDIEVIAIEEAHSSLVAMGCILFLGQSTFGGRYRSREAYGIPVAEPYDKKAHGSNRIMDERTDRGEEARDLVDWIVKVGDQAEERSEVYEWTFAIEDVNGSWLTSDPRNDHGFSITMRQQILSTTHPVHGKTDRLAYRTLDCVNQHRSLTIELSREQCHTIEQRKKYQKIGFWRDRQTGCWFFICEVRIIVSWPDMRVRWRAEIPKSGVFEDGDNKEDVWRNEVFFTSINMHGVKDGDKGLEVMDVSD